MTRLWLLRHAPVLAPAGLCYGASDLPADPEATRAAAQRIAAELPPSSVVLSSPLQRCAELAQAIAALRPELALRYDSRLAEMDFGAWEGRPWNALPRAEFDAWMADFADARAGGTGESVRMFMHRVGHAWDDWRAEGQGEGRGAQDGQHTHDTLWVTHAGAIRAALLLQRGLRCPASARDWPAQAVGFGEWLVMEAR